jgi:phosphoglycerate dehydrogenase-like enzyme
MSSQGIQDDVLLIFLPIPPEENWVDSITSRYSGLTVRWESRNDPTTGDERTIESLPAEVWEGVTILMCFRPPPAQLMPNVRFVQLTSAGVDRWMNHERYKDEKCAFATASGVHSTQIAEWVIGMWLTAQHRFMLYKESMKAETWGPRYGQGIEDSPGKKMWVFLSPSSISHVLS